MARLPISYKLHTLVTQNFESVVTSYPFEVWKLDGVGLISPKSSASHIYILGKEINKETVVDFFK